MSRPGIRPESRISRSARSRMFTGSPISSVNTSPPSRQRRRLEHELDRLVDAHEVPGHVGVGDRDRPARLRSGCRNVGMTLPAAAQHVAEAHRAEDRALGRGRLRDDLLGQPLRGAHHAASGAPPCRSRSARTARRRRRPRRRRRCACRARWSGPPPRVVLEHRHVLVRRGVEDDLGPMLRNSVAASRSRSRTSARTTCTVGRSRERRLDVVQVGLVVVEQDQRSRARTRRPGGRSPSRSSRRRR